MLYKILEVSKQLKVSKQTIYKKLNKNDDLKQYVTTKNNIQYFDEKGLEFLDSLISKQVTVTPVNQEQETKETSNENNCHSEVSTSYNRLQDDYIEHLKKQLEEKDKQLLEKDRLMDKIISEHTELVRNSQILLREKEEKILMLESKEQKKKQNFWKRLFSH